MKEEILYRYFGNSASGQEVEQIEKWLDADTANQEEFDRAHLVFNVMTLHGSRSGKPGNNKMPSGRRLRRIARVAMRAAAIVALAVVAVYAGRRIETDKVTRRVAGAMQTIEVPAGQRISVTLADGTIVWLNSETRLEYPSLFAGRERRVKVSGEAQFDVEHNKEKPFIVETFACELEVLGTKFNVRADVETQHFSAALLDGSLRVSNLFAAGDEVVLSTDEKVEMVSGRLMYDKIYDHGDFLWVNGLLNLNELSFEEAMRKFETCYGVDIIIEREITSPIKFKGKIKIADGVDYALGVLATVSDFKYVRKDDKIYIQ